MLDKHQQLLSQKLKYLRLTNNKTQKEVADLLEISEDEYRLFEKELRPLPLTLYQLETLAEYYKVSIDLLLLPLWIDILVPKP